MTPIKFQLLTISTDADMCWCDILLWHLLWHLCDTPPPPPFMLPLAPSSGNIICQYLYMCQRMDWNDFPHHRAHACATRIFRYEALATCFHKPPGPFVGMTTTILVLPGMNICSSCMVKHVGPLKGSHKGYVVWYMALAGHQSSHAGKKCEHMVLWEVLWAS